MTNKVNPPKVADLDAAVARVRSYLALVRAGKPLPPLTEEDELVGEWLQVTESVRLDQLGTKSADAQEGGQK